MTFNTWQELNDHTHAMAQHTRAHGQPTSLVGTPTTGPLYTHTHTQSSVAGLLFGNRMC